MYHKAQGGRVEHMRHERDNFLTSKRERKKTLGIVFKGNVEAIAVFPVGTKTMSVRSAGKDKYNTQLYDMR